MKILHITPHLGGGVGTVIMDWMEKASYKEHHHFVKNVVPLRDHSIACLDYINEKAKNRLSKLYPLLFGKPPREVLEQQIEFFDIIICHYWDHPMLAELFSEPLPPCRLVYWCHKYYPVPPDYLFYPDLFVLTANYTVFDRVPNIKRARAEDRTRFRVIRSTGDISRFLEIKPKPHKGFNIGYVGTIDYKKIHPDILLMCDELAEKIPDIHFTFIGEDNLKCHPRPYFTFTGKVNDVAPYLEKFDVFGYPLRPDHYGTSEQALGESMAAGVVPVVMDNPAERKIVQSVMLNGLRAKTEADYVRCIEILYHDPDLRRLMSDNARNSAKSIYSIDNMITQWNDVFDEMMKVPKRERKPL